MPDHPHAPAEAPERYPRRGRRGASRTDAQGVTAQAFLVDAHLEGAYLVDAHLERADFFLAHLEGAFLSDAHLEAANFFRTHLEGAYLGGTDLSKARNLSGVRADKRTVWPAGFDWKAAGVLVDRA